MQDTNTAIPVVQRFTGPLDAQAKAALMERFAKKCKDVGDHAIWQGTKDARGRYGFFRYNGRTTRAHRAAWLLFEGEIPAGASVRSTCGTPLCVAPAHLTLAETRTGATL